MCANTTCSSILQKSDLFSNLDLRANLCQQSHMAEFEVTTHGDSLLAWHKILHEADMGQDFLLLSSETAP